MFNTIKEHIVSLVPEKYRPKPKARVPLIRLAGTIGGGSALKKGLNYASCALHIEKAFAVKKAQAVVLVINSPGGAPVQAHLIASRIRALSVEKSIPVYAFVEDVAASGGYMLACAADEIYANPASILGSIGVVSSGFGFTGLIEKIGVERRLHTAGKNKAILDPFLPEQKEDIEWLKSLQLNIHDFFINFVKERRGDKLNDISDDLFTGAFWVGEDVLNRGVVDAFKDMHTVLKEKFGPDFKLIPVQSKKTSLLPFILGKSDTSLSLIDTDEVLASLEQRTYWSRFGL